jgi:hypothetical protein
MTFVFKQRERTGFHGTNDSVHAPWPQIMKKRGLLMSEYTGMMKNRITAKKKALTSGTSRIGMAKMGKSTSIPL